MIDKRLPVRASVLANPNIDRHLWASGLASTLALSALVFQTASWLNAWLPRGYIPSIPPQMGASVR